MADITLDPQVRPVLVEGNPPIGKITDDVSGIVEYLETRTPYSWWIAIG